MSTVSAAGEFLDRRSVEGASIADWFKRWKQNDLNRIAQAVQRGAIEELSVDEVAANVWNACNVSRNSARTVARTIINGVSNAARAETLFANEDAIDGIEFLATLDARTSHICGALDGTVWRGDEMKHARRPPLHPNCRSTLIPVVDLIDPETGEKIEETAERPAQNADGTYSQVAAKTTFKDYFESQPETFQREWLGEKRFELWKSGKLKFEDLAKPATSYRATTDYLTPPTEKPKETAASDDKSSNAQELKIDRSTLPDFDGSPKQNAWAADLREKELDEWEAVALSERVKKAVEPAKSKRRFFYNAEIERQKDLVRAEMEKRGEAVVLAEMEAAAREIAAEIFANPSARDWIDGRDGPSVWARAVSEARRRVATMGSAAKPKPAFDLPPLDLPELVLPRLEGTPRQQSWAEDLRRRAVRDLTEERANETARDNVRHWRQWSSRRGAKKIREALPELEKAIAEVGGDDAAALILGREAFLKAREYVEAWDDSRDWIDLKTEQKVDLNAYAAQKIAGTPQEAAAILRRYAADAKAQAPQAEGETEENLLGFIPETIGNVKETLATRKRLKQARKTAEKLKIKAEYKTVSPDVAEALNEELACVEEKYRDFWRLEKIEEIGYNEIEETKRKRSKNEIASVAVPAAKYSPDRQAIRLRVDQGVYQMEQAAQTNYKSGQWSTPCKRHALRHEIGHAVSAYLFREENAAAFAKIAPRLEELRQQAEKNVAFLGGYGTKEIEEFLAEAFAVVMVDEKDEYAQTNEFRIRSRFAKKVLATLDELRFNG